MTWHLHPCLSILRVCPVTQCDFVTPSCQIFGLLHRRNYTLSELTLGRQTWSSKTHTHTHHGTPPKQTNPLRFKMTSIPLYLGEPSICTYLLQPPTPADTNDDDNNNLQQPSKPSTPCHQYQPNIATSTLIPVQHTLHPACFRDLHNSFQTSKEIFAFSSRFNPPTFAPKTAAINSSKVDIPLCVS